MKKFTRRQLLELAKRYSYKVKDELAEKEIKKWLRNHRYLDKKKFIKVSL